MKVRFGDVSPLQTNKTEISENSTQFQIQRICPILLLLHMMQISVSLAQLGHFHFMECSIPPTPQDLCSVIGDIFVPSIHWILFAISFAESFLESLDVDKSSSQGEVLLHPISFICFCATLCLQNYSWKHKS